jgi:trans-aconitate methyltransferase
MFEQLLGSEWLPSVPELHERLSVDPPSRVADVACGSGWSSISIARVYAKVSVEGIDLDRASIDQAQRNLAGKRRRRPRPLPLSGRRRRGSQSASTW